MRGGIHVSSIVFEVIRTISNLFFFCRFFLRKDFECKKVPKRKINGFHPLRSFCAREIFLPLLFIVCLILFCQLVLVWFAFLRSKSFCQKSKETWNCPDNVKYNTSNRGLFYWLLDNSKNTGIPSSHFLLVKMDQPSINFGTHCTPMNIDWKICAKKLRKDTLQATKFFFT